MIAVSRGKPATSSRTRASYRPSVRCAIYTRKSSEEGLEQEFNSLQAQREACEAFDIPSIVEKRAQRTAAHAGAAYVAM